MIAVMLCARAAAAQYYVESWTTENGLPHNIARSVPPRIESVLIDREAVPWGAPVRVLPGHEFLEIQYTGLSLVNSDRIRFGYRLNGLDDHWVDAGTRRTAYYSHVPPGDDTFSVAAAGGDGVWTDAMASLAIKVAAMRGGRALPAGRLDAQPGRSIFRRGPRVLNGQNPCERVACRLSVQDDRPAERGTADSQTSEAANRLPR